MNGYLNSKFQWWLHEFSHATKKETVQGPNASELAKFNDGIHKIPLRGKNKIPLDSFRGSSLGICRDISAKKFNILGFLLSDAVRDIVFSNIEQTKLPTL